VRIRSVGKPGSNTFLEGLALTSGFGGAGMRLHVLQVVHVYVTACVCDEDAGDVVNELAFQDY
jgi:hypothetical protein